MHYFIIFNIDIYVYNYNMNIIMNNIQFSDVYNKYYADIRNLDSVSFDTLIQDYTIIDINDHSCLDTIKDLDYVSIDHINESHLDGYNGQTCDSNIFFNTTTYLTKILDSYSYNTECILKQFNLDFPRSNIYFNDVHMNNIDTFKHHLAFLKIYSYNVFDLFILILMLCNQSSYAFPYMFLHKQFGNIDYNEHNNPSSLIIITSLSSSRSINIHHCHDMILMSLDADFSIKDIINDTNINTIHINIQLEINLQRNHFSKYGILSWSFLH